MIRIHKPPAPDVLLRRGQEAASRHCADYDADPAAFISGSKKFEFDSNVYAHSDVKQTLEQAQAKKCAFCEAYYRHVDHGDVEHYRPKAGFTDPVTGKLTRPGYYWLAYDWDNLLLSCAICNQQFKRNHFPLKRSSFRATSHHDDVSREQPLLINPSLEDPTKSIGFRGEYAFAVRGRATGKATIEVTGLNRDDQLERRREVLDRVSFAWDALQDEIGDGTETSSVAERARAYLRAAITPQAQYSSMAQHYLKSVGWQADG